MDEISRRTVVVLAATIFSSIHSAALGEKVGRKSEEKKKFTSSLNDWKEAFRWCCCVCYFDGVAVAAVGQSPDIFRFSFFCFVVLFRLSADNDTASETMENWAVVPFFLFSFSHEMRVSLHSCVCVFLVSFIHQSKGRESHLHTDYHHLIVSLHDTRQTPARGSARASWKRTDELLEWAGQLLASRNASSSGIDWHYSTTTQKEPL